MERSRGNVTAPAWPFLSTPQPGTGARRAIPGTRPKTSLSRSKECWSLATLGDRSPAACWSGTSRPSPPEAPQSAGRQDQREGRGDAEDEEGPDEAEGAGIGEDLSGHHAPRSLEMQPDDGEPEDRPDQGDQVSRQPFGQQQRAADPDQQDHDRDQESSLSYRIHAAEEIVGQVDRAEQGGDHGCEGQHGGGFHPVLLLVGHTNVSHRLAG